MDTLKNEKTKVRPLYISDSLKKFLTILNQYPVIKQYWHIENGRYAVSIEQINNDISLMSHGDQILVKFFISVFTGQPQLGLEFDMIEAAQVLSQHHLDVIISWLKDPFWP